jgi:hypothetical protein
MALREAGWRDTGDRRVDPSIAKVILDTHELGRELRQTLVAMAIGALASTMFLRSGGPLRVESRSEAGVKTVNTRRL